MTYYDYYYNDLLLEIEGVGGVEAMIPFALVTAVGTAASLFRGTGGAHVAAAACGENVIRERCGRATVAMAEEEGGKSARHRCGDEDELLPSSSPVAR